MPIYYKVTGNLSNGMKTKAACSCQTQDGWEMSPTECRGENYFLFFLSFLRHCIFWSFLIITDTQSCICIQTKHYVNTNTR